MTNIKNNGIILNTKIAFITMTMLLGIFLIGATSTSAASVKLNDIKIKKTGSRYSKRFYVPTVGSFTVKVRLRTDTLFGYGGQSKFKVQLMRGSQVMVTKYRTVSSGFKNVYLTYNVPSCSKKGYYRVRIRNVSTDNPQPGIANFPSFNIPSLSPKTGNLSIFGVVQGQTENRQIPSRLEPFGAGGVMRITATWDGNCLPDVKGCKLTFRLKRNGSTKKTVIGYAHNSVFAGSSEKMTINYNVPSSMVSGDWSIQVRGSSKANVNNVRTKVKFTPVCQ